LTYIYREDTNFFFFVVRRALRVSLEKLKKVEEKVIEKAE